MRLLNRKNIIITIISILLFIISCSNNNDSRNQQFSDSVTRAFYNQGRIYETQMRPIYSEWPTKANQEKLIKIWRQSLTTEIEELKVINNEGVDSVLVRLKTQLIEEITSLNSSLSIDIFDHVNSKTISLVDKVDSLQSAFEHRVEELGLSLYAKGED